MSRMDPRIVGLCLRHIQEGGAMFTEFLNAHPQIDPNFVDDITDEQLAEWKIHSSILTITQQIERDELNIEINTKE